MTSREALKKIKKIEIVNAIDKWGCEETIHFEEVFDFESEMEVSELLKIIEKDLDLLEKYEAALEAIGEFVRPSILIFKDHYFWENNANDISLNYELPPEKGILLMELFGSRMTLIP